jgi:hypothetical protein
MSDLWVTCSVEVAEQSSKSCVCYMPFECMQAAAVVQMTVLAMCFFGEKAFEVRQSADLVACLRQLDRCIGLLCMYVCPDTNNCLHLSVAPGYATSRGM